MNLHIQKSKTLRGCVHIPTSKSHSIRGLFMALMAAGESTLTHLLRSNDTQDALHVCKTLGAHIRVQGDHVIVDGPESLCTSTDYLNTGNSGITTRFTLPLLGLRKHPTPIIVDCGDQMRTRPIRDLLHALSSLGLSIDSLKAPDCLPIRISGKLQGGQVCLDGLSSQHLSALLLTLPLAHQPSEITVNDLHGQPYIDMTLQWLSSQHIQYQRETKKNKTIYSVPGNQRYHHFHTTLTGDFSSASCPLTAATLLDGHVEFTGLDMADTQGDKQLLFILQKMGAHLTIESTRLSIQGGYPLQGIEIDAKNIPDLLPILAVIGTQATGKTYIYNIKQARFKETDRLHSMTEGLRKMGANLEEKEDSLTIYPNSLHGAIVNGYGDHRTVMALSVAGLLAEGNTCILGSEAIHKTYPSYIHTLCQLGADLYETNSS